MDIYGSQMKRPNDVGDRFSSSTMMTLMFVDLTVCCRDFECLDTYWMFYQNIW